MSAGIQALPRGQQMAGTAKGLTSAQTSDTYCCPTLTVSFYRYGPKIFLRKSKKNFVITMNDIVELSAAA